MKSAVKDIPMPKFKVENKEYLNFTREMRAKTLPCDLCEGYDLSNGKIATFIGFEKRVVAEEGHTIKNVHLRKDSGEWIFCTNGGGYVAQYSVLTENYSVKKIYNGSLGVLAMASMCNDEKEVTALAAGQEGVFLYDGDRVTVLMHEGDILQASMVCYACERMFYADENGVFYSPVSDPMMVAGKVEFEPNEGKILDMVAMNRAIYLLRDGSITVLQVNSFDEGFNVVTVKTEHGKYIPHTACAVGKTLVFTCSDGIYSFDGGKSKKEKLPFYLLAKTDFSAMEEVSGGRFDNYYTLTFTDAEKKRKTVFYDVTSGNAIVDNYAMHACGEEAFFEQDALIFLSSTGEEHGERTWQSKLTDFGFGTKGKTVKKVVCFGHGSLVLTIENESGKEKSVKMQLNGQAERTVILRGKYFKFTVQGEGTLERLDVSLLVSEEGA